MAAPTTPPPDAGAVAPTVVVDRVLRFDRPERNVHWATASLVGVCLLTAAALYVPGLAALVGRREIVKDIHVIAGLSLPLPFLVVRLGPWLSSLAADVRRLNRFDDHDRRWLRSFGRDPFVRNGKFNGGQKLNAAFVVGAILLLLTTGSVMKWFGPFPLAWRTGATFVHDWTAFAFLLVLIGHVAKAFGDREALGGMVGGTVSRRWAAKHSPRWLDEVLPDDSA
ncbi:MAG TPA: cytochrome b/b6 domain-containing protein [Acidimicrobiales bacterium]|nr:cytochrome b/b6 domain-containing protein [Acidimicrobiales bacterium]